jgi:hypothetical protein
VFPHSLDQRFHVIQVSLERFATRGSQSILRLRHAAFEALRAFDVIGLFEATRMDAQIPVRSLEQFFQLIESKRVINR